jgi:hypothetical protein
VQPADELDRDMAKVARNEVEESAGGEQRQRTLQGFEERDNAQALLETLFQAAAQR